MSPKSHRYLIAKLMGREEITDQVLQDQVKALDSTLRVGGGEPLKGFEQGAS